ncbi:MAG: GntR family transcriptional regulator [Planctomycetota bacterium]
MTSSKPSTLMYAKVRDALRADIRRRYRPGSLLPTQQQLAERFDTSLITIKRAISELGQLGLVESVRGRGTVVCRPTVVDAHTGVSSWTDAMRGMGGDPKTAWNRIDIEAGDPDLRRLLRVRAGQTLTAVRRLRTLDGEPVCLITNWLPTFRVPGLEVAGFEGESLYEALEQRYGVSFAYADEEVSARAATTEERKTLALNTRSRAAATVLDVHRTSFTPNDRPVEFACLTAPTQRYTYRVRLQATHPPESAG